MRIKTPQQAERILDAAARLFATQRFHEARMDDIAALAEVSKGTLYRYFTNKDELYLALLSQAAEEMGDRLDGVDRVAGSPRNRLEAVVFSILDFFDTRPFLFDLIQHAETFQDASRPFPWAPVRDRVIALVKDILADGHRSDIWRIDDPDVAALMLLGGLRALVRFGKRPRPDSLVLGVVDGFMSGFCRQPAR